MPFNGSGTFNRLYSWVVDAANNIDILSTKMDAEMNGMAAGLTNCITRDGQSPPSADIPWGAKRITNLAAAAAGTDALNRDTADARYVLASGATNLTLTGALVSATGAFSGNVTIGGTLGVTGVATFSNTVNSSGNIALLVNNMAFLWTDLSGSHPQFVCQSNNNLSLFGTDASGVARLLFSVLMRSGTSTFDFSVAPTAPTPSGGDNSTKLATTAFIVAALSSYAPLASPALTGTPTAPTAAAGTATTQLATTAFVDALRDVPSNAYTTSQTLTLAHRGQGADFNGTTLTCTIPANASVAFPVGTTIVLTNINASSLSIAITTDTLTLAGTTTTGTRTLAQNGMATLRKITTTSWLISGAGLS